MKSVLLMPRMTLYDDFYMCAVGAARVAHNTPGFDQYATFWFLLLDRGTGMKDKSQ